VSFASRTLVDGDLNLPSVFTDAKGEDLNSIPEEKLFRDKRATNHKDESEFLNRLLSGYDRRLDPQADGGTKVRVGIYVNQMDNIAEKTMSFDVMIYLRQSWNDPRLRFNNQSRDKIRLSNNNQIWVPDTFIRNCKKSTVDNSVFESMLTKVSDNGDVWFVTKISLTMGCRMFFQSFPMDIQHCPMMFESFGYTSKLMYFEPQVSPVEIDSGIAVFGGSWSMTGYTFTDCSQNYTTGTYPCLEFNFIIRRALGYYMLRAYLPSIVMVLMTWVAFWLSVSQATARVLLAVIPSAVIFFINMKATESLPKLAYVTNLDVWMGFCQALIFLSLAEYVLVLFLSHSTFLEKASSRTRTVVESKDGNEGEQASRIDQICRAAFPSVFFVFNILYWSICAS